MTIPACSIEKSASVLTGLFGDEAPARARERMDEYRHSDGKEGYKFWLAVAEAATRLLDRERGRNARRSRPENTGAPVSPHGEMLPGHG